MGFCKWMYRIWASTSITHKPTPTNETTKENWCTNAYHFIYLVLFNPPKSKKREIIFRVGVSKELFFQLWHSVSPPPPCLWTCARRWLVLGWCLRRRSRSHWRFASAFRACSSSRRWAQQHVPQHMSLTMAPLAPTRVQRMGRAKFRGRISAFLRRRCRREGGLVGCPSGDCPVTSSVSCGCVSYLHCNIFIYIEGCT